MAQFTAKSIPAWDLKVRTTQQGVLIYVQSTNTYPGPDYHYQMTMSVEEWRRLSTWVEHQIALAEVED